MTLGLLSGRGYTGSSTRSTLCSIFCLPSSCSFVQVVVSAARHAVTFNSVFFFPPLFGESFAGHIDNTTVPYRK